VSCISAGRPTEHPPPPRSHRTRNVPFHCPTSTAATNPARSTRSPVSARTPLVEITSRTAPSHAGTEGTARKPTRRRRSAARAEALAQSRRSRRVGEAPTATVDVPENGRAGPDLAPSLSRGEGSFVASSIVAKSQSGPALLRTRIPLLSCAERRNLYALLTERRPCLWPRASSASRKCRQNGAGASAICAASSSSARETFSRR